MTISDSTARNGSRCWTRRAWAACLIAAARGQTPGGEDWPQFLGPTRNGVSAGVSPAAWLGKGPAVVWSRLVGQGFAGPVVVAGKVLLFHRVSDKETLECLDAASGKTQWKFEAPTAYRDDFGFDEGPRSVPTVAGGRVFTFGAEGALHAVELATGARIWHVPTHRQFGVRKGFFGAACSPLVEDGRVLVNVGGQNNAGIVAFDAATGKVLWTATSDEASYSSPVAATIGGLRRALFFTRAGFVDLDPASGRIRSQLRWRSRMSASVNAAVPLVAEDLVFLSASYGTGAVLLDIRGTEPQPLWQSDEVMSNHYATCVYRAGFLYGYHGRQEEGPSLRCVELRTGKVAWGVDGFRAGTVTLVGDRLLLLKESGELVVAEASPKGFRSVAAARLLEPTVRAYPALSRGVLYLRNESKLAAVRVAG